jgi:hypothetical protein
MMPMNIEKVSTRVGPFTITMDFPASIPFTSPATIVSVTLHLRRQYDKQDKDGRGPMTCVVEMMPPDEEHLDEASTSTFSTPVSPSSTSTTGKTNTRWLKSPRVFWAGATRRTIDFQSIPPQSEAHVVLQAVVYAPGVYNLNRFRLILGEHDPMALSWPRNVRRMDGRAQYLVHVLTPTTE